MNRKICDVVYDSIKEYFGKELEPSMHLDLDSMSVIEVLFILENKLQIRFDITNINYEEMKTIEQMVIYIEKNFQVGGSEQV